WHRRERGLCHLADQAQADRTGLWLGQTDWQHPASDGARSGKSGSDLRTEHGRLQPGPYANLGTGVRAERENGMKRAKSGPNPAAKAPKRRLNGQVLTN